MRIIMLTLCVFTVLWTSANAAEMYRCLDSNGNQIITSAPQDGMTDCELKDSSDDSVAEEGEQKENSSVESDRKSSQADEKLRRQCANLKVYREEERTYCEGIPRSYKSGNEEMKKKAQDRMASSNASASQLCDYYKVMVRELEAKCP